MKLRVVCAIKHFDFLSRILPTRIKRIILCSFWIDWWATTWYIDSLCFFVNRLIIRCSSLKHLLITFCILIQSLATFSFLSLILLNCLAIFHNAAVNAIQVLIQKRLLFLFLFLFLLLVKRLVRLLNDFTNRNTWAWCWAPLFLQFI